LFCKIRLCIVCHRSCQCSKEHCQCFKSVVIKESEGIYLNPFFQLSFYIIYHFNARILPGLSPIMYGHSYSHTSPHLNTSLGTSTGMM
jgi:hypothetical protein